MMIRCKAATGHDEYGRPSNYRDVTCFRVEANHCVVIFDHDTEISIVPHAYMKFSINQFYYLVADKEREQRREMDRGL